MKKFLLIAFSAGAVVGAVYIEHRSAVALTDKTISIGTLSMAGMVSAPIPQSWILDGKPDAKAGRIAQAHDGTTKFIVWTVSAGRFNWYYDFDETVQIVDGDVYLTDSTNAPPGNAAEKHLVAGDVVFFRNGSSATWRVPDHVKKIATVRYPLPEPIASLHRWSRTLKSLMAPRTDIAAF